MATSGPIVEGDCLGERGLAMVDSCDVVITDPPYEAECHGVQRRRIGHDGPVVESPLDFVPITSEQRFTCAEHFARICKRWIVVFCQTEAAHKWRECLEIHGLDYVRTMVWIKPDAQPQYSGDRPGVGYESIVVAHRPGRKRWNGGGRVGVFAANRERGNANSGAPHPTTKPMPLMRELVELFSDPGELVIDPFAGSGSTGVACRELGRRFLGWEVNAEYADVARRRVAGQEARPNENQRSLF